ncbi:hypothetical protein JCM5350_001514 [Sporobolomyces pararoseus]
MNHLYHTLSPLIIYTAFLVSLLAFLAPTPIFPDRVSLLSVTLDSSRSTSSNSTPKRWLEESELDVRFPDRQRMVKRAKKVESSNASSQAYNLVYGPLGACLSVDSSDPTCTSPTFTPIFVDLYSSNMTLPASTIALLPDQLPLAPAGLFVSLLLLATQLLAIIGSSISMHANKKGKAQGLAKHQPAMRKVATVVGILGLAVMLAATLALRTQFSKVVDEVKKAGLGTANLGTGFAQLFAGAALEIVVSILLVAEAFTSR